MKLMQGKTGVMRLLSLGLILLLTPTVQAKVSLSVKPDDTITAEVATLRSNRVFVKNERIQAVPEVAGEDELEKNEANSAMYFKIDETAEVRFTFFITRDKANHYQALLTPDEEADAVIESVPAVVTPIVTPRDVMQMLIDSVAINLTQQAPSMRRRPFPQPQEQYLQDAVVATSQQQLSNVRNQAMLDEVTNLRDKPQPIQAEYLHAQSIVAFGLMRTVLNRKESTYVLVVSENCVLTEKNT